LRVRGRRAGPTGGGGDGPAPAALTVRGRAGTRWPRGRARSPATRQTGGVTEGGGARVLVEVLGPLRAVAGGRAVTPPGPLQRRRLALRVLRRRPVVPAERAIQALWPAGPPRDPTGPPQHAGARLRR